MPLTNKIAIVTGGGLNIGLAITREMAKNGAKVVIADIAEEASRKALRELTAEYGEGHTFYKTDMTAEESLAGLKDFVMDAYGRIDILVNNAGVTGPQGPVDTMGYEGWKQCIAVNLDGVFLACKHIVQIMKAQKQGCIVNIASITGKRPLVNRAPYCASKMGVIGLSRCLAEELGPFGIRVNSVCPGSVDSPRLQLLQQNVAARTGISFEEAMTIKKSAAPLNTLIPPSAVGDAVVFLCSEKAAMITGVDLNVAAGVVMY